MKQHCFIFVLVVIFGLALGHPLQKRAAQHEADDGCVCQTYSCGCCTTLVVPEIGLNDTICINFAYLPNDYGVSFSFMVDSKTIINETISMRSPIPICFPVPVVEELIDFCVHFRDLDVRNATFHGCVDLELRMFHVFLLESWDVGCFDLGAMPPADAKRMRDILKLWAAVGYEKYALNKV